MKDVELYRRVRYAVQIEVPLPSRNHPTGDLALCPLRLIVGAVMSSAGVVTLLKV
jgi:hypothetical protein